MKNFRKMEQDIRGGLKNNEAYVEIENKYGHTVKAYSVNMGLGISKKVTVLAAWQTDEGSKIPRFITTYPAREGKNKMIKLYDTIMVKKTNSRANVVEIDDDNGTKPPIYLVEIVDEEKPDNAETTDVIFWCESDEIYKI